MARDITAGFQTEIEADQLSPILLYKAEFDSGDVRFWSGYGELTFNAETYVGSGQLLNITRVEETSDLVANNVTIELSGIPASIISIALTEDYQSRPVTVWFGVIDTNGALVADPYQIFKGKIDIMNMMDNGNDGVIKVLCESDLIDLNNARERRYTAEDQKSDFPSDLGLDFVAKIQDIEIQWGATVV